MKSKKFVLAGLVLLAITGLLALAGCKNDSVPEPTRYTVKFDKGDNSEYTGDLPADITVESGTKLTTEQLKVLDSTDNYIFEGWYDGETKAEGGTYTVTKDVTLVAKWKPRDQVQISFKVSGNTVELSSEPAEATIHYTTDGTEPKENWDEYANPIEISSKTTIKAYAEKLGELKESEVAEKTYLVVTFNANGGTFADGKDTKTETVESGQPATKPTNLTNGDMVLAGWYTLEDDGTTLADTAYSFDTPVEGDIILYAAWNGRDSDGNIVLKNKVMSKTSEEQVLPTGTFQMGSTAGDADEKPVHGVTISKGYFMGRHEVTQQLYLAVMGKWGGTEPSSTYGEGDEYPAYYVSWYDAVVYCNRRSIAERLTPCYAIGGKTDPDEWGTVPTSSDDPWEVSCNWNANGYRLPTEAEWEYAARAGDDTTNARTWSGTKTDADLGKYAWFNGRNGTSEVGKKAPNAWGLYDMNGNVWEWCWDWYDEDYYSNSTESVTNPTGPADGSSGAKRVNRGGGWIDNAGGCTVSLRGGIIPNGRSYILGFRLVRSAN